jgi:hypothetical protein
VILDLTGRSPTQVLSLHSALVPGCRLELAVLRRPLVDEDAAKVVADVTAGTVSPWVLGWVPLMRRGEEAGIINEWQSAAHLLFPSEHDRADLGTLALTFSTLASCRGAWGHGLRGWNMMTSPYLDEIRAQFRAEERAIGRVEGVRATVLRQGRQKFRKAPSRKQQKALEALTDFGQLEALAARLLTVDSWAELFDGLEQA